MESAFECLVLLEVFLILVEGGGSNRTQFASCQCRFQDVGSIHSTLTTSGTNQCVYLINEENDASLAFRHLVDDALQTFLKLTFILRTCHERTHVEGKELLVLQVFGHVTTHDTLGQTFYNGCFTCARLTNQDRVVLRTATQDLQYATDLVVAPNHRIEFALTGQVDEVLGIFTQRLIVVVGTL